MDGTIDELAEQPVPASSSSGRHELERSALLGTDIGVFKNLGRKADWPKFLGPNL